MNTWYCSYMYMQFPRSEIFCFMLYFQSSYISVLVRFMLTVTVNSMFTITYLPLPQPSFPTGAWAPPPQIVTQTNSTCLWCNNLGLTQSSCIPELFYPHNLWQTWGGKHNSKVVHNVSRCALEANLICTVHVHVWLQFSNVCSSCKKKNLFILWVGAR